MRRLKKSVPAFSASGSGRRILPVSYTHLDVYKRQDEDQQALEKGKGFRSKMDKALFADSTATSIGAILGTSNTTTYVESAAGIGAGGRTGLTSVVTAVLFILSAFFSPLLSAIPSAATAPALIAVGIMMLSSFKEVEWTDLNEAIPAFFAGIFMACLLYTSRCV